MTQEVSRSKRDDDNVSPTVADVAAYWDRRPCNIRHSLKPVGTREYFDEVEARKYLVEPHIPGFAQFERWRGKRVLEVGCGIGTDAVNFARAGADYTAVELSRASLDIARKRFEVFGLAGRFLVGNAQNLTDLLPNEYFDLVYAFGVIHHTPDQRAAVEQIRHVMSREGEFRCMLYAKHSWKHLMIEAGLDQPEAQLGCPIATTFDNDDIHELFDSLFKPISISQAHIFPYVVEKYVRHEYEIQPWFRAMPRQMFETLESRLGWHLLVVALPV